MRNRPAAARASSATWEPAGTVVVMALEAEAAGVFADAGIAVLYCGVGKVNAAIVLTRELSRYPLAGAPLPLIVNFGTAGSRVHPTGTFLACHEFIQRDMDVRGLGFALGATPYDSAPASLAFAPIFHDLTAAVCGSGDSFAIAGCDAPCAVLDMEAYALAKVCWAMGAAFGCVKYVTDGADPAAAAAWQNNLHKAANGFLNLYRGVRKGPDRVTLLP